MRRVRDTGGYALLAALIIVALAAAVGATCIAAVGARQDVTGADSAAAASGAAVQDALGAACERIRWAPDVDSGSCQKSWLPDGRWTADWRAGDTAPSGFSSMTLEATSMVGSGRAHLRAVIEMRAEPCAQGVVVAGDVELHAPVRVTGSGLYSGGCLRGREWLRFGDEGDTSAEDGVHPDVWSLAAVHALGSIWAEGKEIHAADAADRLPRWADDNDTHTAQQELAGFLTAPGLELMCALREHSVMPGEALVGDVLDLSLLPPCGRLGDSDPTAAGGYVVLVRPREDAALLIVGRRPVEACPITLVVDGDAAVGQPGSVPTEGRGALVVTGRLEIQGPAHHVGHIRAASLTVTAPAVVEVPGDWRIHPLPGLTAPVIVALSET